MEKIRLSTRQEQALKWLKREYTVEEIMENFIELNDLRMRNELEKLETLTPEQKAAFGREMADFRRRLREAKERLEMEVCC
ncbi:hypothetical protein P4518_08040 [Geobacillus thermodenitrificans]|uniref:hypothetical protein n=1 Tax=Geobacillus thermodenitrificans TaxID=33940 RepID=UPI002E1DE47E|nr:hypothetical protein [Geobacillus thermodenitrificans]